MKVKLGLPKTNFLIYRSFQLLSFRDRLLMLAVSVFTISLAMLDLLGVMIIGVIGSISATSLSGSQTGNRVIKILQFIRLDELSIQQQVAILGCLATFVFVTKTILSLLFVRRSLRFLARRGAKISADLIAKYFSTSLTVVNQRSTQESIYSLTSGVNFILVGVIGASVSLVSDFSLLIILGMGLFIVDFRTALLTLLIFGFITVVLHRLMHTQVRNIGEKQSQLMIESALRIQEAIYSYRELVVRNRRAYYANLIGKLRYQLADGGVTISFMGYLSKYVLELTLVLCALSLGVYQFSTNPATRAIATLTIFIAASSRIVPALLRLQQGLLGIRNASAQAKPTFELIDQLKDVPALQFLDTAIQAKHRGFIPTIQVSDIYFAYEENLVLSEISLEVLPGEFVALVGSSGAGKTTLIDIILGILNPKSGSVEISGLEPRDAFANWPGAVAYVPQDLSIIDGTIRENLGLGFNTENLDDELCWKALSFGNLEAFVRSLPEGLDSLVGDRGTKLSGGQKQRLGISRALLTKPKLLILDEATSSLDSITEAEISNSLLQLKESVTLVVIAHRLSTIINADRIYYLENGRIEGVGNFEELKEKSARFMSQAKLMGV